jgi:hypothetical protein
MNAIATGRAGAAPTMKMRAAVASLALTPLLLAAGAHGQPAGVTVVPHEAASRVDIAIDGAPFTSYLFGADQKKPVLYPLRTAQGTLVTRGWPLDPRPDERVDHPHHVGLWYHYGDVNGLDFWNNSTEIRSDRAAQMGTILHRRIAAAAGGPDSGALEVEMDWVDSKGTVLLTEATRFEFRGDAKSRTIDRITRLTAAKAPVVLGDNKEGLIGIRVARALEQPSKAPDLFTGADGKAAQTKAVNNNGVTGEYVGSDGKRGDAVWGTRGPWTMLGGTVNGESVTLAILDHPSNPGFPTYWHARGYGLYAANNLGQKVFDPAQPEARRTIDPGESLTFRHRVLILSGAATPERIAAAHGAFTGRK